MRHYAIKAVHALDDAINAYRIMADEECANRQAICVWRLVNESMTLERKARNLCRDYNITNEERYSQRPWNGD